MVIFAVRTGKGGCLFRSNPSVMGFSDTIEYVRRIPRKMSGWECVCYKGKRYQLFGGIHTDYFIDLLNPIRG